MSSELSNYFSAPASKAQKKYEALRSFFYEKRPADEVAERFGYRLSALYSLTRDFRDFLKNAGEEDMFFLAKKAGRREKDAEGNITALIVNLRKK